MVHLMTLIFLPSLVAGATLHSERPEPIAMMRRHTDALQLNAGGDMIVDHESGHFSMEAMDRNGSDGSNDSAPVYPHDGFNGNSNHSEPDPDAAHVLTGPTCYIGYAIAQAGQKACNNPATQTIMESSDTCLTAGKMHCPDPDNPEKPACVDDPDGPFVLVIIDQNGTESLNIHPKGCFITQGGKWHYNPAAEWPDDLTTMTGQPVCEQVMYQNGTTDSNDCASSEYEVVANVSDCQTAAKCLGGGQPEQFRNVNRTEQDLRPKDCHWEPDGAVMFNPADNLTAAPSAPLGTPICKLTQATMLGAGGAAGGAAPEATPAPE